MPIMRRSEGGSVQITHIDSGDITIIRIKKVYSNGLVDLAFSDPLGKFDVRRSYNATERVAKNNPQNSEKKS